MNERRIASVDEMFDLLATMADGKFATMCYVNAVPVYKTKSKVDLDRFGQDLDKSQPQDGEQDPVYDRLRQYHDDDKMKKLNLGGIVSVTRYNLNWSSEETHNKNLSRYMSKKDEIDKRWGIYKEPEDRRAGGFDTVNTFGASLGTTDNTKNRAYIHQNTAKARIKSDLYAVDEEGNIIGGITKPELIQSLRSPKSPDPAIKALQALEKTDEEIKQYQKEIADLNFRHQKFLVDKILYIVATIGDDKFVYINDYLSKNIDTKSKMTINTQQFIDLANKMFVKDETMTEAQHHRFNVIKESMMRMLSTQYSADFLKESINTYIIEDACYHLMSEEGLEDYGYEDDDWDDEEEETDPVEEYEKDYPNSDFNPSAITQSDLAKWCQNVGDFLFICKFPIGGLRVSAANSDGIQAEIVNDVYNCSGIEPTHEVDYMLNPRKIDFEGSYVSVIKLKNAPSENGGDYYIIYETPKDRY